MTKMKRYKVVWADSDKKLHHTIVEGPFKRKAEAGLLLLEDDKTRTILAERPCKARR